MIGVNRKFFMVLAACLALAARSLPAAPAKTPDEVFKEKGLVRVGSFRVVPEEGQVLTGTQALRAGRARQAGDYAKRRDLTEPLAQARAAAVEARQRFTAAANELSQHAKSKDRDTYATAYNTRLAEDREAVKKYNDLLDRLHAIDSSRSTFISLTLEMMDRSSAALSRYLDLAADPELTAALAASNQGATLPIKLGPSTALTQAIEVILACRNEMVWDAIPFDTEHASTPRVPVTLNGTARVMMIWDSGASTVSLNAETAAAAGLHPTDRDPTAQFTTADGTVVHARVMTLRKISIGGITLENVQCSVDEPGVKSPNLLGQTFQQRCVAKLDAQRGQLILTQLEPPEPGYKAPVLAKLEVIRSRAVARALPATAPAARPKIANRPPEEVLKDRGLSRLGFLLVTDDEATIHTVVSALRAAKTKVDSEKMSRREMGRTLQRIEKRLTDLTNAFRKLNDGYQKATTPEARNQYVGPLNANIEETRRQKALYKEELRKFMKIPDAGLQYIGLSLDAGDKAQRGAARYAALAVDDELKDALEKLNRTAVPKLQLGPSGMFQSDFSFARSCKVDPDSGEIPIVVEDGNAYTDVVLNEKIVVPMVWDSGASDVLLSAAMADALDLHPTDQDPTVRARLADGRLIEVKHMTLRSVRVGAITAYNVECSIMPPDVKVDQGLLGISFQKQFNCRLDLQASTLHLTRLVPLDRPPEAPHVEASPPHPESGSPAPLATAPPSPAPGANAPPAPAATAPPASGPPSPVVSAPPAPAPPKTPRAAPAPAPAGPIVGGLKAGLIAELYAGTKFYDLMKRRIDPQVNFDWGLAGPDPSMHGERFSIRWTGILRIRTAGNYEIHVSVDDSMHMFIDDKQVISRDHHTNDEHKSVNLTAGLHTIRMEYRNVGGIGHCIVKWVPPGGSLQEIPRDAFMHKASEEAGAEAPAR